MATQNCINNTLGVVAKYNGITTAGSGLLSIVAQNSLTGQTAAISSVCAYTPASGGIFRVSGYITITAVSLDVIQFQVSYTDETSTSRNLPFFPPGLTSANLATTGVFPFAPMDIRSASASAITVLTALTTGTGSIAYNVSASIMQIA